MTLRGNSTTWIDSMPVGAPEGNQNGAKSKRWTAAIERALIRAGGGESKWDEFESAPMMKALDQAADTVVQAMLAGPSYTKGDPWLGVAKEFGDRLEGKAHQSIDAKVDANVNVQVLRFTDAAPLPDELNADNQAT